MPNDGCLRELVLQLVTAIEWEVPAIRDGVDVDRRLDIIFKCATEARVALTTPSPQPDILEVLRPFSKDGPLYSADVPDSYVPTIYCPEHDVKSPACFTVGDLRRAASFFSGGGA